MSLIGKCIRCLCFLLFWAIGFTACQDEYNEPTGFLYLNVQEDATLLTKAGEAVVDESLQVAIIKADGDTLKVYQDYLQEVKGERLILPVGTYTVAVSSNHDGKARWETPFYAGSTEVTVKQGEIATETVTCTIANTKVSVVYDKALADFFSDYQATVSNPSGKLTYTRDEYRSGFFSPEKLTVSLNLTNSEGYQFTLKNNYSDIKPKCHYIFRFSLNNSGEDEDDLGLDIDVSIDTTSYKEVFETIYIKQEELSYIAPPRAKDWVGFDSLTHVFGYKKGKPLPEKDSVGFTIQKGKNTQLTRIQVTTDSPKFIQAGLGSFDLLKENEASQAIALGFPEWPVAQEETLYALHTLDFSALIPNLSCGEKQPIEHKFTMEFLDDKNQVATVSYTFRISPNLPAIANEPYCWSTFALLTGNSSDATSYFVVNTPTGALTINDPTVIKRDNNDGMFVLLTGMSAGEYSYYIKSADDEAVQSNVVSFTLYDPLQGNYAVPNLSFDTWTKITENRPDFKALGIASTKEYWAPNATSDFNQTYWESGNFGASAGAKVLLQSTDDVAVKGDGKLAAQLTSMFVGVGTQGAFSAGSVFSGSLLQVSEDGAKLRYGRLHNGFPTHLSGYYKYSPADITHVKNESNKSGEKDEAIIYVALSTKAFDLSSLRTNVKGVVRFNKNAPEVIAYGEFIVSGTVSAYTPFDIPLEYRQGKMPTYSNFVNNAGVPNIYIIIVATSSINGDEFTGGPSVLYVDEFKLDYGFDEECLKETDFSGYKAVNLSKQTSNE